MSLTRPSRPLLILGLAVAACTSAQDAAPAETDAFAFPVVEGIAVDGLPIFRERGFPRAAGTGPEVDQIALIARVDGAVLSDAVSIRAFVGEPRFKRSGTVIDGRTIAVSGDGGGFTELEVATLSDFGEPGLLVEVRGLDPVAYLMNGALAGISASISSNDEPQLKLTAPPEGYAVVIAPTTRSSATPQVTVELEGPDTRMFTTINDPRLDLIPQADFEKVTVGERQAWRGQVGQLAIATWEEPAGVFTWAMSYEPDRTDALVESTTMTDESTWREFYGIDEPSELLAALNGREFEAVSYEGYPFDPAAEDRPLTMGFTDDVLIVRGVCSSRNTRVASQADTVESTGPMEFVGVGCDEFQLVDTWQTDLTSSPLTLSLTDKTLTVRATVNGNDVVIELAETTFTGYS